MSLPGGVYVPPVVFFTKKQPVQEQAAAQIQPTSPADDEYLDFDAIKQHILRLARGGVRGVLCQGSNGEAQHLTYEERSEIIKFARKTLDDNGFQNTLVIAGTGGQSTRETIKLTKDAHAAGASRALILTPATWKPALTNDLIVKFFHEVADASPIPILVYNFPTVTAGLDLDSHTIARIGQHQNVVGCKLSDGHLGKLSRLHNDTSLQKHFKPFIGRSDSFFPALTVGAIGGIMASVNIAPRAHRALLDHFQKGEIGEALEIHRVLANGDGLVGKYGGIGFLKAVVADRFGYGNPVVRGPLANGSLDKLTPEDLALLNELVALEKSLPDQQPS